MFIFIVLIACAVMILILQRKCWLFIWKLNGFVGILQQPLLWLHLIFYLEPLNLMDGIERWRKHFHRPLAIIVGTRILLYIDDPYTIEEVLTSHECQDKTFLQEGFFARNGLLHARGQQWKIRRKHLNPAFGHSILLSFFHIFNSVGNQLRDAFSQKLLLLQGDATAVNYKDIEDLLSRSILEVSCQTTLGMKMNFTLEDANGIARTYKKLLEISALRIIKPWLQNDRLFRLLDRSNYEVYVTCNKLVHHFVEKIVRGKHEAWLAEKLLVEDGKPTASASTSTSTSASVSVSTTRYETPNGVSVGDPSTGNRDDSETLNVVQTAQKRIFIEQIFHLATLGEMSLEDIMNETHAMILVSFETVSNSLTIALLLLAMHTDCQQRLRTEINEIFSNECVNLTSGHDDGDGYTVPPDTGANIYEIDASQLQRMKYLDMIVNESLRLLTTVPINLRHVSSDFQLRLRQQRNNNPNLTEKNSSRSSNMTDFFTVPLPRDSIVVVDTFNMQRDCRNWGPKAKDFIPERFMSEQTENRHPYAFIPFSKGLRTCIGWRYSMLLMKIFLVKLISCYEFSTTTQLTELRFVQGISLKFRNADRITFQIRQLREAK